MRLSGLHESNLAITPRVILLENIENYEPPLVASCLSADPFQDNGFMLLFFDLWTIRRFVSAVQSFFYARHYPIFIYVILVFF
jgi:hypothetical protein